LFTRVVKNHERLSNIINELELVEKVLQDKQIGY